MTDGKVKWFSYNNAAFGTSGRNQVRWGFPNGLYHAEWYFITCELYKDNVTFLWILVTRVKIVWFFLEALPIYNFFENIKGNSVQVMRSKSFWLSSFDLTRWVRCVPYMHTLCGRRVPHVYTEKKLSFLKHFTLLKTSQNGKKCHSFMFEKL